MTLPANIRINTRVPFPSQVRGTAFITIAKANGIFTITPDYVILNPAPSLNTAQIIAIYDPVSGTFQQVTIATFASLLSSGIQNTRTVTAAGDITVLPTDDIILVDKAVGAPTNIILPAAASRTGRPLTVKDLKGDANTNKITFVPVGAETIDGFSPAAAIISGVALIDINYGKRTLYPLPGGGGWYI